MPGNELSEAFEQAWAPFREAVEQQKADLGRVTAAGWTVKEMLSHVAFWDEGVGVVIDMILRGGTDFPADWPGFASGYEPPDDGSWPDADTHNAREAEWGRAQPDETVLKRLDDAHAYALAQLERLTPQEVEDERFRDWAATDKIAHYEDHLRELTA